MRTLVLGTANRKKGLELAGLVDGLGISVITLADVGNACEVEESGETFGENARLKACRQAAHLGQWVLADDSGLAVDALQGAPGVRSARYAGPDGDDAANRRKLLAGLEGVPMERRGAHFVCHLTLADPTGAIATESEGRVSGRITLEERGEQGFGYDSLFEVLEYHRTFGELGPAAKAILSHRARAVQHLLPELMRLADTGRL